MKSAVSPKNKPLGRTPFTLAGILAGLFIGLAIAVHLGWLTAADTQLSFAVYHGRHWKLTTIMLGVTSLASPATVLVATLGLAGFSPSWRAAGWRLGTIAGGGLLTELLKSLIARPRPSLGPLLIEPGYSFPSGHAMTSLILYGLIGWLISRAIRPAGGRWLTAGLTGLIILAVGSSRVYLGVHYPSDIIGGYLAGGAWLTASIAWWKKHQLSIDQG